MARAVARTAERPVFGMHSACGASMSETRREFDHVIVGGGSAGCVLANRLSEDPSATVCLLEAGPRDRSPWIHVPLGVMRCMFDGAINWKFSSAGQTGMNGRSIYMPRGRTLGGSSSINGMIYIRGHRADYDDWAALGNEGWGFDDVLPYFRKSENNLQHGDADLHGDGGPLDVTYISSPSPLHETFFRAAEELQYRRNDDFNGASQEGFGIYQVTQRNGRRLSTARAFLKPIEARKNLSVITGATATRIRIENGRATGIEARIGNAPAVISARRELVLSAGALLSPKLLMLSGIGDAGELGAHGIASVHQLPGVGRNLHDHPAIHAFYRTASRKAYGLTVGALPELAWWALEYAAVRTGLFSSNMVEAGGFVKTRSGLERPDIQFNLIPGYRESPSQMIGYGRGYVVTAALLRPTSRGSLTLADADPETPPRIDPNLLGTDEDLDVLTDGLAITRRLANAPAFSGLAGTERYPGDAVQSRDELRSYVQNHGATIFHPVGTCRMGSDEMAVVDSRLRVRGLAGLRVVDASIMPSIVGGNTNAPTIMIAEKAADMIREDARA